MNEQYSESTEGMDVAYVAHLARIKLTDEEIVTFQGQLDQILGYVAQLGELDVDKVEPMAHAIPVQNVFRKDEVRESLPLEKVLGNAPAERSDQFLMPKIVE